MDSRFAVVVVFIVVAGGGGGGGGRLQLDQSQEIN
jgi:hypothetical protein